MKKARPVVLKFGGDDLEEVGSVVARIAETKRAGPPVVVVVSARRGVTDALESLLSSRVSRGELTAAQQLLESSYPELANAGRRCLEGLDHLIDIAGKRPLTLPERHQLLSGGERLSSHWLSSQLMKSGLSARPVEADRLGLLVETRGGAPRIALDRCRRVVASRLLAICRRGEVPVVTGFFGRGPGGTPVTLGRGSSDYTATAIGAALGAGRVELIKHHAPLMSADPAVVRSSRPIARLSYDEAEALAQMGARVLHPLSIAPARENGIEIRVRSLKEPAQSSRIGRRGSRRGGKAVALLGSLEFVPLDIPAARERPHILRGLTEGLSERGVVIQALFTSSEGLFLLLRSRELQRGLAALRGAAGSTGASAGTTVPVALVTVIGERVMDDIRFVPKRLLYRTLAFWSTGCSLSLVVPQPSGRGAATALHRALIERRSTARR
ncbi:MAG: hypothetical protein L3K09_00880 [Thermoplasmata archaeon]|nr:hypothetical protein [Thermoplasmata archaeon]